MTTICEKLLLCCLFGYFLTGFSVASSWTKYYIIDAVYSDGNEIFVVVDSNTPPSQIKFKISALNIPSPVVTGSFPKNAVKDWFELEKLADVEFRKQLTKYRYVRFLCSDKIVNQLMQYIQAPTKDTLSLEATTALLCERRMGEGEQLDWVRFSLANGFSMYFSDRVDLAYELNEKYRLAEIDAKSFKKGIWGKRKLVKLFKKRQNKAH